MNYNDKAKAILNTLLEEKAFILVQYPSSDGKSFIMKSEVSDCHFMKFFYINRLVDPKNKKHLQLIDEMNYNSDKFIESRLYVDLNKK